MDQNTRHKYSHKVKALKYHNDKLTKQKNYLQFRINEQIVKKKQIQAISIIFNNIQLNSYKIYLILNILHRKLQSIGIQIVDIFNMIDRKYQGQVCIQRFFQLLNSLELGISENEIRLFVNMLDQNCNKTISEKQFKKILNVYGYGDIKQTLRLEKIALRKYCQFLKNKNLTTQQSFKILDIDLSKTTNVVELRKFSICNNSKLTEVQIYLVCNYMDPQRLGVIGQKTYIQVINKFMNKHIDQTIRNEQKILIQDFKKETQDLQIDPTEIFDEVDLQNMGVVTTDQLKENMKKKFVNSSELKIEKWINLMKDQEQFVIQKRQFLEFIRSIQWLKFVQDTTQKKQLILVSTQNIIKKFRQVIDKQAITVQSLFNRIDKNGSRTIDFQELEVGLQNIGLSPTNALKILSLFDKNNDGIISFEEFRNLLEEKSEVIIDKQESKKQKENKISKDQKKKQTKKQDKKKSNVKKQSKKEKNIVIHYQKEKQDTQVQYLEEQKLQPYLRKCGIFYVMQNKQAMDIFKSTQNYLTCDRFKIAIKQIIGNVDQKIISSIVYYASPDGQLVYYKEWLEEIVDRFELGTIMKKQQEKKKKEEQQVKKKEAQKQKKEKKEKKKEETVIKQKKDKEIKKQEIKNQKIFSQIQIESIYKELLKQKKQTLILIFKKYDQNLKYRISKQQFITVLKQISHCQQQDLLNYIYQSNQTNGMISYIEFLDNIFYQVVVKEKSEQIQTQSQHQQNQIDNQLVTSIVKKVKFFFTSSIYNYILTPVNQSIKKYEISKNEAKKKSTYQDSSTPTDININSNLERKGIKMQHISSILKTPLLFKDGINPNDISQGSLGDCYLLSSLSALAQFPLMIRMLFENYQQTTFFFGIWLCTNGEWKIYPCDGWLPVVDNNVAFANTKQGELWVALIQKTYASAYGGYKNIQGGQTNDALKDLTGAPGEQYDTKDFSIQELFKILNDANSKKFIMTAGSLQTQTVEQVNKQGIAGSHAYSILDVREVTLQGRKQIILQMRNPWGSGQWKGVFSDDCDVWQNNPHLQKQLNYQKDRDDGIFWIPINNFKSEFQVLSICKINPTYYQSHRKIKASKCMVGIELGTVTHGYIIVNQREKKFYKNTPSQKNYCYSTFDIVIYEGSLKNLGKRIKNNQVKVIQRDYYLEIQACEATVLITPNWRIQPLDYVVSWYGQDKIVLPNYTQISIQSQAIDSLIIGLTKNPQSIKDLERANYGGCTRYSFSAFGCMCIVYVNNDSKTFCKQVEYTTFQGLKLCPPYKGKSFKVNVPAGESVVVKMQIVGSQVSYGYQMRMNFI